MTPFPNFRSRCKPTRCGAKRSRREAQGGLVLIVSIVLLAIVSILATFSTRNAASSENVSGNVRLTELAMQAAEIALRHCENSVADVMAVSGGGTSSYPTDFMEHHILPGESESTWQTAAAWDQPTAPVYILPLTHLNQPDLAPTYKRPAECMVARLPFVLSTGAVSTTTAFVITARGFGPDVPAADPNRSRPMGSEVWLQSQIELQ